MEKRFKVNRNCSYAFIMSLLSGTPSNSKYLNDLLNSNLITINDAKKCLIFCHFTNPIFIIGTIGYTFLGNKKLGLIILVAHYTSSIILGLFNKKSETYKLHKEKQNTINNSFINVLKASIKSTSDTLLLMLGIITTCIIITCVIDNVFNINNNFKFLYGIIEITQGLKYLSLSSLSIELKCILSSFIISFGGFCIHLQVFSILNNKKIRYLPYLLYRLIHGVLASILSFILLKTCY